MNLLSPTRLLLVAVIAFVFGAYMLYTWIPIAADSKFPIVTGKVTQRTPIKQGGVPRVDFTIEVSKPPTIVHAHTQRYLIDKVPDDVRFRYSGDPEREVYLMDHEENPLWIALFCFGVSAFLGVLGIRGLRRPQK